MARYITLSKAARLVGVKRGTLQKRIRAGELSTFEGELDVDELLRAYPETQMEDNTMIERVERFMEQAFAKAMRNETEALDLHTLAKRVSLLGQELAAARAEINRYADLMNHIKQQVAGLQGNGEVAAFKSWFVQALEGQSEDHQYSQELLDKETFLRILAAHVRVIPSGHDYFVEGSRDLLDAGLSDGLALRYGCSDGSCGRCRGRLISGEVRQTRTPLYHLSEKQRANGELLLCCHTAVSDVVIEAVERHTGEQIPEQRLTSRVRQVQDYGNGMTGVQLILPSEQRLEFQSGQYVRLQTQAGMSGEYSIASCPCDATKLEFHIQRGSDVRADESAAALRRDDPVGIIGPYGRFVLADDASRPLLLIALDAGFAPIKGLIEHAIALDLVESIDLYWVDTGNSGHYLGNQCRAWADALDIFDYHPLTAQGAMNEITATLLAAIQDSSLDLAAVNVYVAGDEKLLPVLGRALLGAGVAPGQLHLEPLRQGRPVVFPGES